MVRARSGKNRRIAPSSLESLPLSCNERGEHEPKSTDIECAGYAQGRGRANNITAHHSNQRNQRFKLLRASNRRLTSGVIGLVANSTVALAATQNPAITYSDQS